MKNYLTLFFLFIATTLFSQDAIYKIDNTKIDGKVLEINSTEIKYKIASHPDGPLYVIKRSDVVMVVYQNGSHDTFSDVSKGMDTNFCRNHMGLDMAEFISLSAGVIYERIIGKKGYCGLRVPFSVGLTNRYSYYNNYPYGKIFSTGVNVVYYPTGQSALKYFTAPYFEWGMFRYSHGYYYRSVASSSPYYYRYSDGQHLAGGILNGLVYRPTQHFSLTVSAGLGLEKNETHRTHESIEPHLKANVIIGYRFCFCGE